MSNKEVKKEVKKSTSKKYKAEVLYPFTYKGVLYSTKGNNRVFEGSKEQIANLVKYLKQ